MKVKIKNHIDLQKDQTGGLSKEKTYKVLAINSSQSRCIYRIEGDDGIPAYYNSYLFDITCGKISSTWMVIPDEDDLFFGPPDFFKYFWNEYFEGESQAIETYKTVRDVIFKED